MFIIDEEWRLGSKSSKNSDIEEKYGREAGSILERTGIIERRKFSPDENPIKIASDIVRRMLGSNPDCERYLKKVYGGSNPYSEFRVPSETHQIAHGAGLRNIGIHHTNYGCGGYLAGLEDMVRFLDPKSIEVRYAFLILSDHPSKMVRDFNTEALFTDAVYVALCSNSVSFLSKFPEIRSVFSLCCLENPSALNVRDGYWQMDGKKVVEFACKVPPIVAKALGVTEKCKNRDYSIVPHQANPKLLETIEESCGMHFYKDDCRQFGNATCSSLFIAANRFRGTHPQAREVFCFGFGDTESMGGFLLEYPSL